MAKYSIVERDETLYIVGPRAKHQWHGMKDMWPVCQIDNYVFWDDPQEEETDRAYAQRICDLLNGENK